MNKYQERKQHQQEIKSRKEVEQAKWVADIRHKAEVSRRFINDKRHEDYKALMDMAVAYKRSQLETLAETVKSDDELRRQVLIISTEIKTINWILNTPEKFIKAEEITEEKP